MFDIIISLYQVSCIQYTVMMFFEITNNVYCFNKDIYDNHVDLIRVAMHSFLLENSGGKCTALVMLVELLFSL